MTLGPGPQLAPTTKQLWRALGVDLYNPLANAKAALDYWRYHYGKESPWELARLRWGPPITALTFPVHDMEIR